MNSLAKNARQAQCGFTLLEAMVAIAVMLILTSIAVPSFKEASLNSQLRASANDLVVSTHFARSEAMKRNAPITMCMSSDGEHCATTGGWEQGWIVRGAATLRRQSSAPSSLRISAGAITNLTFQPTGVGATAASFRVCRAPSSGREGRLVTVDVTGRAWV